MRMLLRTFFILVALACIAFLIFGFWRTRTAKGSSNQDDFLAGTAPTPIPDGLYAGSAEGYSGAWQGKKFDRASQTGINVFKAATGEREKYPFKMSVGKGISDTEEDVLQVDYDIDGNPFWLRPVLDEVVQIAPGVLLGKLQYRLIPRYPFTITFFRLEMK